MNEAFEKILDMLEELKENYGRLQLGYNNSLQVREYVGKEEAINLAKKIVQEVAEEYNDDWIPCSERLPDIEVDVLLTLRNLDIYTGFKANTDGYFYIDGVEGKYVPFDDIVAWKPLPKPYIEK